MADQFTPQFLDRVRERIDLADLIRPSVSLRRSGRDELVGLCPFHGERTPSFTVAPRKGFYHCFGCGAHGGAIDWIMEIEGREFVDAVLVCASIAGIAVPKELEDRRAGLGRRMRRREAPAIAARDLGREAAEARRAEEQAAAIWRRGGPIAGTIGERYFRSRGILAPLPATLRFVADLDYFQDDGGRGHVLAFPAVVAGVAIGSDRRVVGIHRTYLRPDGSGKAQVRKPKRMRGTLWGGAVRLAPPATHIGLCEGIETGLSIVDLLAMRYLPNLFPAHGDPAIWSALSLGAIGACVLPDLVQAVTIYADNDNKDADKASAQIARHVDRFRRRGCEVAVARPPRGEDWNDALRRVRASRGE